MSEHTTEKKDTSILNANVGDYVKTISKSSWIKPVSLFFLLVIVFGLGMSMGDGRSHRGYEFYGNGRAQQSGCDMFQKVRGGSDYTTKHGQNNSSDGVYGRMDGMRYQMMKQGGIQDVDTSFGIQY